jgi:hypothetical protein
MNDERLERELRAALLEDDPGPVGSGLRARIAAVPDDAALRPRLVRSPRVSRLMASAAAVAALVLVGATLVIGLGARRTAVGPAPSVLPSVVPISPAPSAVPSGSPAPTPGPSGLSPVPGPWGGLHWLAPIALPVGTSLGHFYNLGVVTSFNGQLFAVGRVPAADGKDELAFWRSSDGTTWTLLTSGGAALADAPRDPNLVATPNGLVAWGFVSPGICPVPSGGPCGPAFLTSTDGVTWTRTADVPTFAGASIQALASGPHGLVAVGDTGWDNPAIWVSDTGGTWQRLTLPAAVFGDAHFATVRATSTGYVLAGGTGSMSVSVTGGPMATVSKVAAGWWSPDGRTWTKATVARAAETGSSLGTISVGSHGLVAVGASADGRDHAAWTSPDGHTWTPIAAGYIAVPATSTGVATLPSDMIVDDGTHLVAVAVNEQLGLQMWTSSDGVAWQPLPFSGAIDTLPAWPGAQTGPVFDGAMVVPDGLVVIGHSNSSLQESVWHAVALP